LLWRLFLNIICSFWPQKFCDFIKQVHEMLMDIAVHGLKFDVVWLTGIPDLFPYIWGPKVKSALDPYAGQQASGLRRFKNLGSTCFQLYWLSVGQRLCINFSVLVLANFLTTLHSHLDITCSCFYLVQFKDEHSVQL